ncbi:MAG: fluoride efflux transporter CrcB [Desulfuromonadaceae bacterium]|nr:fluoride efflux transporter CrcB [Desulfuromonadaceae bacterium]
MHLLYIGVFGGLGCVARYQASGWINSCMDHNLPCGTLGVNIIGSLLLGMVLEPILRSTVISDDLRLGICVGFLGGFTTFSTFAYESWFLLESGQWLAAGANIMLNVGLCLFGTAVGITAVRLLV